MANITLNAADIRAISTVDRDELGAEGGAQHRAAIIGVILNRVAHPAWPDNVWDVLNQAGEFQGVARDGGVGNMTQPNAADIQRTVAAIDLLRQYDYSNGAGFFANPYISDGVAGTGHDMFTIHDQGGNGAHTFVAVTRYFPHEPVPDFNITYANDSQTQALLREARSGTYYRNIINRIQAMDPDIREAFMQELIAGLGTEELASLENIQTNGMEYQSNDIATVPTITAQRDNCNEISLG